MIETEARLDSRYHGDCKFCEAHESWSTQPTVYGLTTWDRTNHEDDGLRRWLESELDYKLSQAS